VRFKLNRRFLKERDFPCITWDCRIQNHAFAWINDLDRDYSADENFSDEFSTFRISFLFSFFCIFAVSRDLFERKPDRKHIERVSIMKGNKIRTNA